MQTVIKRFAELTAEEVYDALELRNDIFIVEQHCPYTDIDGLDRFAYHVFFCDETGRMVAYLRILDKGQAFAEIAIGRVLVDPAYRRQGLAKKLMLTAMDFIRETLKEPMIRIAAQVYLVDFYAQLGFVVCSDIYIEDGIAHRQMLFVEKN